MLPPPFDRLKLTQSAGTQGGCYAFCLTSLGKFYSCYLPQGYRIRNSYSNIGEPKLFFLECRSIKHGSRGLLAAILPFCQKGRVCEVLSNCDLAVVRGITQDDHIRVNVFKKNKSVVEFAAEHNIFQAIPLYFNLNKNISMNSVKVIYINSIAGDTNMIHPFFRSKSYLCQHIIHLPPDVEVEGSATCCDIWFVDDIVGDKSSPLIKFMSKKRFKEKRTNYGKKKRRNLPPSTLPWQHQRDPSDLIIVTDDYHSKFSLKEQPSKTFVYLMPYNFGCFEPHISFAPILDSQFKILKKRKCHPFQKKEYIEILNQFLEESGLSIIEVINIVPGKKVLSETSKSTEDRMGGSIVCHLPSNASSCLEFNDKSSENYCEQTGIKGIYLYRLRKNIQDFELPFGGVSVFRGNQWPYITSIPENVFDLLARTYTSKGLTRKGVPHSGNFEMIGSRTSNQSTGSMICFSSNTQLHEYYRSTMDSALLPLVRSTINGLQQESLKVAYSSGESLMMLYKRENKLSNPMELCEQTIITQRNFCNVVHIDKCSYLQKDFARNVLNTNRLQEKERIYLDKVKCFGNTDRVKLPKSTTCAWTLRSQCTPNSKLFQYFVSSSSGFAYDLSSYNLEKLGTVGATFQSSLFEHCTSVPVWFSKDNSEISLSPYDERNYIFAWGSNGGSKDK